MWEISYNHLYTCCKRNQCDIYHTQLMTYNTTIKLYCFMCDHMYTVIFSGYTTVKLLKRGVIMNFTIILAISMMDILGQKEILHTNNNQIL
jgi:hypothetical protein